MINNVIALPDFKMDKLKVPDIKVKSIGFYNFKVFKDTTFDFSEGDKCKPFVCFVGPNGCGKSSVLDAIQLLFSRFDGRESDNIKILLGRLVRHVDGIQRGIYENDDFLISATINSSLGDYGVEINKSGFIKDHPEEIKQILYRLCFYARFDQELHQFQLARDQWPIFKELFESVTGFKVDEMTSVFDESPDPVQADILRKYVLGFWVNKPDERISHKECSAGERKIIKSFSTLLNKEYNPSVVCIDNAEMHVETGRHIHLIESMKKCFPSSQIFASTHSYQISRNFGKRDQIYDLRLIKSLDIVKKEKWRLYLADEIGEGISRLKGMYFLEDSDKIINHGYDLLKNCFDSSLSQEKIIKDAKFFLCNNTELVIKDIVDYYSNKNI